MQRLPVQRQSRVAPVVATHIVTHEVTDYLLVGVVQLDNGFDEFKLGRRDQS